MKITKKILMLLIAMAITISFCSCEKKVEEKENTEKEENVLTEDISGIYSAVLEPISVTDVTSDGKGKIEECFFEKGDTVKQGDLLFRLEDNGLSDSIATAENAVQKSDINIETATQNVNNLKVYAPASGIIKNFNIKKGERVNASKIGEIFDEDKIVAIIPFNENQKDKISLGDKATVTSAELMGSATGTVTRISAQKDYSYGSVLYNVEITIKGADGFYNGLLVSGDINTKSGVVSSPVSGSISMSDGVSVVSKGSGNATAVYVKNGDYVKAGQLLVSMENQSTTATLKRARLDREDLYIKLSSLKEDYEKLFIYAPVSGKITQVKKGENDYIASSSDLIMTISDDSMYVGKISVEEKVYDKLSDGESVSVNIDSQYKTKGILRLTDNQNHNGFFNVEVVIVNDTSKEYKTAEIDLSKFIKK